MEDLGEVKKIPAIKIERDKAQGHVKLTPKSYLKVLQKFDGGDSKPFSTPLAPHSNWVLLCLLQVARIVLLWQKFHMQMRWAHQCMPWYA